MVDRALRARCFDLRGSAATCHRARSARSTNIFQEPVDELRQTGAERRRRIVTEQFPRLRDIGAGDRHVSGLLGQLVDLRFAAQLPLDAGDQIL